MRIYKAFFKAVSDRSSIRRKEVDLLIFLPFLTLAFSFWASMKDVLNASSSTNRKPLQRNDLYSQLADFDTKKARALEAYIVICHLSLGIRGQVPLFGGIRLVREKILPASDYVSI